MSSGKRGRSKLGIETDCGAWLRRVTKDWLDGHGPGGTKTSFPSATKRIAAGEVLLRMADGCPEARSLRAQIETRLREEIRKARKSS